MSCFTNLVRRKETCLVQTQSHIIMILKETYYTRHQVHNYIFWLLLEQVYML